ncbi:MAG: Gfo/Idh/MocA family oxidoreductase [Gammaproteobacteria bacterium]|nr:Gfo/Idh/MocA family oxidoreductase [Gammaproteobacteria bacterium]
MTSSMDRREFVKQGTAAGVGIGMMGMPNLIRRRDVADTVSVAVMGVNSRGHVLAESFASAAGAEVVAICDVDSRATSKTVAAVTERQDRAPVGMTDFRRTLDDPNVDALVIAAPDHWHTPAALMALQAGKHVYLEKPCSHNPHEGELLVEAQAKYDRVVQMGNQQRSAPRSIDVIGEIHNGLIGRAYFARAWYANTRGPIGNGRSARVPDWLDYELWQGPAPRTTYRDNVVHYNWHWFWRWGTGEVNNNGTHEIDVCRWALDVEYPSRVTSAGGRYHDDDDWEFYDTQICSFDFAGRKTITWEGRSCNGRPIEGRGRGASIHGEDGTVVIDRSGYVVYDNDNNEIKRNMRRGDEVTLDTRGGGSLTDRHIDNFLRSVRGEATPTAPIHDGRKSQLLCHLANIAQRTGDTLTLEGSRLVNASARARAIWSREYEPGWEPTV